MKMLISDMKNIIQQLTSSPISWIPISIITLLAVLFAALYLVEKRRGRLRALEIKKTSWLNEKISASKPLEDNLNAYLEFLSKEVEAAYFAFYVIDNRGEKFMLRAAIHPFDEFSKIGPSYSGLALPKKEVFIPPVTMDVQADHPSFEEVRLAEAEFVFLKTFSERALVRIGPIRKLNRKKKRRLRTSFKIIEPKIEELIDVSRQKFGKRVSITTDRAVRTIASIATSVESALEIMMRTLIGESDGVGGIFIDSSGDILLQVDYEEGLATLIKSIHVDQGFRSVIESWLEGQNYYVIANGNPEYYDLPEYVAAHGIGGIVAVKLEKMGTMLFFYDLNFDQSTFIHQGLSKVRVFSESFQQIAKGQVKQKWFSKQYTQQLKKITDAVEMVNPYSVGYSEMVARFSLAIGHEMNLSEKEMDDLALASYFSNVGTLGMDHRIFNKHGMLSEEEFEQVKQHSEIGSAMILIATGNRNASLYVLHHHERVDGNGYPSGIDGSEIPIGAKIIHMVQFLLAKIDGRPWRSPITFAKAIEMIRAMSGTQLDSKVVDAFLSWYYTQASDPMVKGKSLDTCFHLCATPKSLCTSCPVYQKVQTESINCWEVGSNLCKAHGRTCETCFVRTEFMERDRLLRIKPATVLQTK